MKRFSYALMLEDLVTTIGRCDDLDAAKAGLKAWDMRLKDFKDNTGWAEFIGFPQAALRIFEWEDAWFTEDESLVTREAVDERLVAFEFLINAFRTGLVIQETPFDMVGLMAKTFGLESEIDPKLKALREEQKAQKKAKMS